MKKAALIIISLLAALWLSACSLSGKPESASSYENEEIIDTYDIPNNDDKKYDIALITDSTGIETEGNLSLWKSVIAYGDTNCKTYHCYSESDSDTAEELVKQAVEHDAQIIILPDASYTDVALRLQDVYHDTNFLLIDAQSDELFAENVHCVKFREEQAGYLAGYLAVTDGYQSLGFIGNADNERNRRYLYGMVQGADDAAQKLRLHDVRIVYEFIDDNAGKAKSMSKKFYDSGVEVIFTCTENISKGAAQSAKSAKKKLICGENVYGGTENVSLGYVKYDTIKAVDCAIKSGFDTDLNWLGDEENQNLNLGLDSECIEMPTDKTLWKFKNITSADYEDIRDKIISGEVEILDTTNEIPPIAAVVYSEFE